MKAEHLEAWIQARKVVITATRASGSGRWTAEVRAQKPRSQLVPDLFEGYGPTVQDAIAQACERYDAAQSQESDGDLAVAVLLDALAEQRARLARREALDKRVISRGWSADDRAEARYTMSATSIEYQIKRTTMALAAVEHLTSKEK